MSLATGSNPTTTATAAGDAAPSATVADEHHTAMSAQAAERQVDPAQRAVDRALAAAIRDSGRIGDLLDALRTARLWLPLPDDGTPVITGTAVTLPTVSYLGTDFVPAYSSAELLLRVAYPDQAVQSSALVPHAVVRAADLARLLPPSVGIALNAGASESVPVYPLGVSYLAAEASAEDRGQITVGPLPVQPDELLAAIGFRLAGIPQARDAAAAWICVRSGGEGLLISVTLDDPADATTRDAVIAAVERAAWTASPHDAGFPIDVTFPGEAEPDHIDAWVSAFTTPFHRRPG